MKVLRTLALSVSAAGYAIALVAAISSCVALPADASVQKPRVTRAQPEERSTADVAVPDDISVAEANKVRAAAKKFLDAVSAERFSAALSMLTASSRSAFITPTAFAGAMCTHEPLVCEHDFRVLGPVKLYRGTVMLAVGFYTKTNQSMVGLLMEPSDEKGKEVWRISSMLTR